MARFGPAWEKLWQRVADDIGQVTGGEVRWCVAERVQHRSQLQASYEDFIGSEVELDLGRCRHAERPEVAESAFDRRFASLVLTPAERSVVHDQPQPARVASSYLSPRSREMLERLGVGYIDITGNVRIEVSEPGLFISTSGADRDPWPQDDELQSLRGRRAARAVRAIIGNRHKARRCSAGCRTRKMSGEPDPQYVRARRVLLDAADALAAHLDSVVLVGAQAVYLHTGEAELLDAAAPYTTDADLAIGPADLADSPLLDELPIRRGFTLREPPGRWVSSDGVYVDLMVPEALAGPGSRGAWHACRPSRQGPRGRAGRPRADADPSTRLDQLRSHELSAVVTAEAIGHLEPLFGSVDATGVAMAVRAAGPNAAPATIAASLTALVSDLLSVL